MSRHTLTGLEFGAIVLGWDAPVDGFFLQCFVISEWDDDEPSVWLPKLDLAQLTSRLHELGVPLPDLLRRVLLAEKHGWQLELLPGDPVLWRNRQCLVLEVRRSPTTWDVLIQHSDCSEWTDATQLLPDLQSVGVN